MSKLHDCKRGLSTATPSDYNQWWRRIRELEEKNEDLLDRKCSTCGQDERIAEIGKRMGFRPDVGALEIRRLEAKLDAVNNILTGSEAIYGFAAWLTTQKTTTTMGSTHDCAPIVDSVDTFCKVNNLSEPRENWTVFLTHPPAIGEQE